MINEPNLAQYGRYQAESSNARGNVKIFLTKARRRYNETESFTLTVQWSSNEKNYTANDPVPLGDERWKVERIGGPKELAAFIEKWVPQSPDVELMNEALEKLKGKVPEGLF